MAVRGPSYSQLPTAGGDGYRLLLIGQVLFWSILGLLYFSYMSSGESVDALVARHAAERAEANVVKMNELRDGIPGSDKRGWIMSPLHAAAEHGLGGATSCIDVHVGTIGPMKSRANHRHHRKNESFLVWGAHGKWRIENKDLPLGFAEVELKDGDVSCFTAPAGRGHALINADKSKTLNLMVCADTEWDPKNPDTDYHVWTDL